MRLTATEFNLDIPRDGKTWERKYRFETSLSFQYPALHEHEGVIWLAVTQGATKERIVFGQLETVGQFDPDGVMHTTPSSESSGKMPAGGSFSW